MKFKLILFFSFTLLVTRTAMSQNTDFGVWYGLNTEYSISKKIELNLSGMIRTYQNAHTIEEAFLEGGARYKFNKYLSVGGAYRITDKIEDNSEYYARHKLFTDIKGTLPAGRFSFSTRLMFQYQSKTYIENPSDEIPDYHFRIKLKTIYKIPTFPVNPYLYFEYFTPMFEPSKRNIDKERFAAGLELKITREHSVDLEYLYERDFEPRISDMHILSFNYTFKF